MITKEDIAKGYDKIADKFNEIGLPSKFYDDCLKIHKDYSGRILDIGCGSGTLLKKLSKIVKPGVELFGLDISERLCEITRKNNPQAKIICGDAEALPFNDSQFDFVFMTEALEHMLNYNQALSEVRRVLRQGGIFIVTVPNRDWFRYEFYDKIRNKNLQPVDDHYFRFKEIKSLLKDNNFEIKKNRGLDNLFYYGWIHNLEEIAAFFLPFLHRKMKRLLFKCVNNK